MYVFLPGAEAAAVREGGWEGIGEKLGWRGGKEGQGTVLLALANSSPPSLGLGQAAGAKGAPAVGGVELRALPIRFGSLLLALAQDNTSAFILNLLSVSIYVSLPA